jgi:hypothetical protein
VLWLAHPTNRQNAVTQMTVGGLIVGSPSSHVRFCSGEHRRVALVLAPSATIRLAPIVVAEQLVEWPASFARQSERWCALWMRLTPPELHFASLNTHAFWSTPLISANNRYCGMYPQRPKVP